MVAFLTANGFFEPDGMLLGLALDCRDSLFWIAQGMARIREAEIGGDGLFRLLEMHLQGD